METRSIKDFIHLYLGCKCVVQGEQGKHKLTGISYDDTQRIWWAYFEGTEFGNAMFEDVAPLLRPLESMTEEELFGLINSTCPDDMTVEEIPGIDEYDFEMFYNDGGNLVDSDVAVGANYTCGCTEGAISITKDGTINWLDENGDMEKMINAPRAYHYLLSKHFDLFGLIPSALALDKNKNN